MENKTLPILPAVMPWKDEIFFNDDLSDEFDKQVKIRRDFILDLMQKHVALKFSDADNPERFFVFSPCVYSDSKYQLTRFDEFGAVWDSPRDNPKDFVHEISNSAILTEIYM